jgi:hypothetical protein
MRNDFPTPKPTAVGFLKLRGMGAKIEGSIPRGLTSPKMVIQKKLWFSLSQSSRRGAIDTWLDNHGRQ